MVLQFLQKEKKMLNNIVEILEDEFCYFKGFRIKIN